MRANCKLGKKRCLEPLIQINGDMYIELARSNNSIFPVSRDAYAERAGVVVGGVCRRSMN